MRPRHPANTTAAASLTSPAGPDTVTAKTEQPTRASVATSERPPHLQESVGDVDRTRPSQGIEQADRAITREATAAAMSWSLPSGK